MSRQVVIPQISDNGESNMKSNSPGNRNQVFGMCQIFYM